MPGTDLVTLKGGVTLPLPALQLAWDLESRGFRLGVEGDALTVAPKTAITPADDREIRVWRDDLKAIAAYQCPEVA
jgi:hypothetical protein